MNDYTQNNRRAWNEIAQVRSKIFPPTAFFAQGGSTLEPVVMNAVRQAFGTEAAKGLRVIHLQCATGEDTLSWSVLGAQAVGVDISDQQVEIAIAKARDSGLSTLFAASDVYDLPASLPENLRGPYDLVYTGGGAIVWLPDLTRWAQVITALLRPGGRLILKDDHPISGCLWEENGQIIVESDYFGRGQPEVVSGWFHFKGGEDAREIKYEFSWPLGDVVTALAQSGLIIEHLEEFPGSEEWRAHGQKELFNRLPGSYLLVARKG